MQVFPQLHFASLFFDGLLFMFSFVQKKEPSLSNWLTEEAFQGEINQLGQTDLCQRDLPSNSTKEREERRKCSLCYVWNGQSPHYYKKTSHGWKIEKGKQCPCRCCVLIMSCPSSSLSEWMAGMLLIKTLVSHLEFLGEGFYPKLAEKLAFPHCVGDWTV